MWDTCTCAARTVAGFHRLLHRELDEVLAATLPQRSVMLALDGPAPLAKLLLQRCGGQKLVSGVRYLAQNCHVACLGCWATVASPTFHGQHAAYSRRRCCTGAALFMHCSVPHHCLKGLNNRCCACSSLAGAQEAFNTSMAPTRQLKQLPAGNAGGGGWRRCAGRRGWRRSRCPGGGPPPSPRWRSARAAR